MAAGDRSVGVGSVLALLWLALSLYHPSKEVGKTEVSRKGTGN